MLNVLSHSYLSPNPSITPYPMSHASYSYKNIPVYLKITPIYHIYSTTTNIRYQTSTHMTYYPSLFNPSLWTECKASLTTKEQTPILLKLGFFCPLSDLNFNIFLTFNVTSLFSIVATIYLVSRPHRIIDYNKVIHQIAKKWSHYQLHHRLKRRRQPDH